MANSHETTFKDLQMDERYKKLERTLKMVLLKNADRRNSDNGMTGTWPSISSINGDNLDTSCAAMSVQSSRIGSEVIASSTNFRQMQSHKKQYNSTHLKIATSSENQFPINKDSIEDSAMMPPPRTPGICFSRSKRFSGEPQRVPLLNMPINPHRNNNGFTISTPANSISSIPKSSGSMSVNSSAVFQENNDFGRNVYEEDCGNGSQRQERSFSRWRVLLNDKGQLIIKGTLECGKVARSKPVIRRLTSTSVQSIFKHIYHLQGNLVDERGELPEYVSGKFFNGFPDDWENVYQVWRNYLSDGSRLSFRWPTAVTDSDDDIKSGITEISYRPELNKYKKSVSPRKRKGSFRASTEVPANEENTNDSENRFDPNRCSCSHNSSSSKQLEASSANALSEVSPRVHAQCNRSEICEANVAPVETKKSHDMSSITSLNTTEKIAAGSLKDIIQEDKLNIIIDNLTNKNCSIEYINKIVEMFDCMKFVVSYKSSGDNDSDKNNSVSQETENSRHLKKNSRSTEENNERSNTPSVKTRSSVSHNQTPEIDKYDNATSGFGSAASRTAENSYKDKYSNSSRETRRKLTKHDYESSESENDYYEDTNRRISKRGIIPKSQERLRRSNKQNKNYQNSIASRTSSRHYDEPERSSFDEPRRIVRKYIESSASRNNTRHDSSISDEEDDQIVERRVESKTTHSRAFVSPRKCRTTEKDSRRRIENYDSSISITEDEDRYAEKSKEIIRKNTRMNINYDSSVSITEDEHGGDIRGDRRRIESLQYYPESNPRRVVPASIEKRRNGDARENRVKLVESTLYHYPESNFRPVEPDLSRNIPKHATPRKMPVFSKPMLGDENRNTHSAVATEAMIMNHAVNSSVVENKLSPNQHENSAHLPAGTKRSKKSEVNQIVETETMKTYANIHGNEIPEFDRSLESPEKPSLKNKAPQDRKKSIVVSSELTDVNLKTHNNWLNSSGGNNENDQNIGNTPRVCVDKLRVNNSATNEAKNAPNSQKSCVENLQECAKIGEQMNKEINVAAQGKTQDGKSGPKENKSEKVEKSAGADKKQTPIAKFGSQENPKLLTAWVPAVVCDDEGDSKYHLIFEGKLLNEAGHVANRKFATDFIRRRVSAKLVETIGQEFYELVGDLNDTKHVVPKELLKLCHSGCPGRIPQFCEKWRTLTAESNKTPVKDPMKHNTSVDCLGVPTSSRGRRILPPLNYWAGERIATKDNKAIYSPGNSQESSIPSSLEKTNEEIRDKKSPPSKVKRAINSVDQNGKRAEVAATKKKMNGGNFDENKRQDADKVSPVKHSTVSPEKGRTSQRARGGKRRLAKNVQASSSESSDEQMKPTPRKRKTRTNANDPVQNSESTSTRKMRYSSKNNTASSQNVEIVNGTGGGGRGSSEKIPEPDVRVKLRKRQKIDYDEEEPSPTSATPKQFLTRRNAVVTCTHYKNVPIRDDDLSEDQLSTM